MTSRRSEVVHDTAEVQAQRIDRDGTQDCHDTLTVEAPLQLRVNGEAFTTTMRTPGDEEALARGLLFTEGIVIRRDCPMQFSFVDDPETGWTAAVEIEIAAPDIATEVAGRRSLLSASSCGMCGTKDVRDIEIFGPPITMGTVRVSPEALSRMMQAMRAAQRNFSETGGCHAAAIFDAECAPLAIAEDIGRHNAVDKCVGKLLVNDTLSEARVLTVSGRLSYEIVFKAYKAGIPVLASVSAPSSMAVETAARVGQTLVAFCRDDRMTVYTHSERIARDPA